MEWLLGSVFWVGLLLGFVAVMDVEVLVTDSTSFLGEQDDVCDVYVLKLLMDSKTGGSNVLRRNSSTLQLGSSNFTCHMRESKNQI